MYGFQSLTGLMPETDILKVNNLIVRKDATIGGSLEVAGPLILPEGAALDNEAYPAPSHRTLLHLTHYIRKSLSGLEPNQRGFLTHFKFYNVSLILQLISKSTVTLWSVVHEQTSVVGLGWQTIELTSPVPVKARQTILAAMLTNGQPYAYIPQDFDVLLDMDPAVYIGNDGQSTETVFWFANRAIHRLRVILQ